MKLILELNKINNINKDIKNNKDPNKQEFIDAFSSNEITRLEYIKKLCLKNLP